VLECIRKTLCNDLLWFSIKWPSYLKKKKVAIQCMYTSLTGKCCLHHVACIYLGRTGEWIRRPRATHTPVFWVCENTIILDMLQNFATKYHHIHHIVIYKCVNFKNEIYCILDSANNKSWFHHWWMVMNITVLQSRFCHFY
jgi:hypothetical protein